MSDETYHNDYELHGYSLVEDDGEVATLEDEDGKRERWVRLKYPPAHFHVWIDGHPYEFAYSLDDDETDL